MFVFGIGMVVADDECIIVARSCFQHLLGWNGTVVSSDFHSRSENSNLTAFPICECPLAMSHHCSFARWT